MKSNCEEMIKIEQLRKIKEVKETLARQGKTLADWARANGYKPRDVYLVVGGQNKALYGRGFEIARNLGLK